jgi:hypothetical protein
VFNQGIFHFLWDRVFAIQYLLFWLLFSIKRNTLCFAATNLQLQKIKHNHRIVNELLQIPNGCRGRKYCWPFVAEAGNTVGLLLQRPEMWSPCHCSIVRTFFFLEQKVHLSFAKPTLATIFYTVRFLSCTVLCELNNVDFFTQNNLSLLSEQFIHYPTALFKKLKKMFLLKATCKIKTRYSSQKFLYNRFAPSD